MFSSSDNTIAYGPVHIASFCKLAGSSTAFPRQNSTLRICRLAFKLGTLTNRLEMSWKARGASSYQALSPRSLNSCCIRVSEGENQCS